MSLSPVDALIRIAPASVVSEQATGVPAELTCVQCIVESGWLNNAPEFNCFGIKSYVGEYGRQLLPTREWFTEAQKNAFLAADAARTAVATGRILSRPSGVVAEYNVKDWFATFPSLADCFNKHARLFIDMSGPYAPVLATYRTTHDLSALFTGIAAHYATDPHYASTLLQISMQYNVRSALQSARASVSASVSASVVS